MPEFDEPRYDDRPPGFACGLSFGMLGPTRLVVVPAFAPEGFEAYESGLLLPYRLTGGGSPPWFAQWRGTWSNVQCSVFLSLLNASAGLWRMNVDLNATPPSSSGGATREITNFTWQFPGVVLSDDVSANWSNFIVYRVAEWSTPSERFPGLAIPDAV